MSLDLGLLILRLSVGLILAAHGAQKLFGWFEGHGFASTTGWLGSIGLKPAPLWALLAGLGEFGGGLLLALGLLNPIGPLGIIGAMLMATGLVHWSKGFWGTKGGYEYPLVLLIISAVLGLLGTGSYALDPLLGIALPATLVFWGGLVLVIIAVGVGLTLSSRHAASQQQPATSQGS